MEPDENGVVLSTVGEQRELVGSNCFYFNGTYGLLFNFMPQIAYAWVKFDGENEWQENYDLLAYFEEITEGSEFGRNFNGYIKFLYVNDNNNQYFSPCEQNSGFFTFSAYNLKDYAQIIGFLGEETPNLNEEDYLIYSKQDDCPTESGDSLGYSISKDLSINAQNIDPATDDRFKIWNITPDSNKELWYSVNQHTSSYAWYGKFLNTYTGEYLNVRSSWYHLGDLRIDTSKNPNKPIPEFDLNNYTEYITESNIKPWWNLDHNGEAYIGIQQHIENMPEGITSGGAIAFNVIGTNRKVEFDVELGSDLGQEAPVLSITGNYGNIAQGAYFRRFQEGDFFRGLRDFLLQVDLTPVWNSKKQVINSGTDNLTSNFKAENVSNSLVLFELGVFHYILFHIGQHVKGIDSTEFEIFTQEIFEIGVSDFIYAPTLEDLRDTFVMMYENVDNDMQYVSRGVKTVQDWIQETTYLHENNLNRANYLDPGLSNSWAYSVDTGGRFSLGISVREFGRQKINFQGFINSAPNFYEGLAFPEEVIGVQLSATRCAAKLFSFTANGVVFVPSNPNVPGFGADGKPLDHFGQAAINAQITESGELDTNPFNSPLLHHASKIFAGSEDNVRYYRNDQRDIITMQQDEDERWIERTQRYVYYGEHTLSVEAHPDDPLTFTGFDRANGYNLGAFTPDVIYEDLKLKVTSFGAIQYKVYLQVEGDHTDLEQVSLWVEGFGQVPFYDVELVEGGTQTRWTYPSSSLSNAIRSKAGEDMLIKSVW